MSGWSPIHNGWHALLKDEWEKPYWLLLKQRLDEAYRTTSVAPNEEHIFRALRLVPPLHVRVVILGQDPYHTPRVADGLAFSMREGGVMPPSLRNIFREIGDEYGAPVSNNPDLTRLATQGVLLLNTTLTVRCGDANSHASFGWHMFTDAVITAISRECDHVAFMLWGKHAQEKRHLIDTAKHCILESAHPSPLSAHRGFLGNGHFKKANAFLKQHKRGEILWCEL